MAPVTTRTPLLLVILAGGGFTFETSCLLRSVGRDVEFVYLVTEFGGQPGTDGIPPGQSHPVPSFASKTRPSRWRSVVAFLTTFRATLRLIRSQRADAIVGVGCSHSVPMFLAARALRRPTIYLESITRVDRLSATGRIVHRLRLADTFIVQWPGLQKLYPSTRLGTIL